MGGRSFEKMNDSLLIIANSFQDGWIEAVHTIKSFHWDMWSLVVQIKDVEIFDRSFNSDVEKFALDNSLLKPKTVAYTIFPFTLHRENVSREKLYERYLSYFNYPPRKKSLKWGTYFYRMINYETSNTFVNQLDNIIEAINNRKRRSRAAYTIIIEKPGGETIRPLGAPCLNYIAVQYDNTENSISLLATYRNHDFLKRAYGNYWGLCKLIKFIADSTHTKPGRLTCISSHAYIDNKISTIQRFLETHPCRPIN
jgi:thymidylate synthase